MALTDFENRITNAVEKLGESVVTIRSRRMVNEFPFGNVPVQGSGSGFLIDSKGYVVTNYHVVSGAKEVQVHLKDGRTFIGSVVGGDKYTDVVLVKIEGKGLPAAKLGDSERLKVGQTALAIGNALDLPGAPTMSLGVISALSRPLPWTEFIFEGLIQTDAPINPGNSGGPLADSDGNVIGMNTAIIQSAQGVGFAIPINTIKWVIEQIAQKGRIIRPMLGISAIALNPAIARQFNLSKDTGILIADIVRNGPAHQAGLQGGDILEKIGAYEVKTMRDLFVALSKLPIKEDVAVKVLRAGKPHETKIKLMEGQVAE